MQALAGHPDVPLLGIHLLEGEAPERVAATGLPGEADLRGLTEAALGGEAVETERLLAGPAGAALPRRAFVAPVARGTVDAVDGFLIAGLSDDLGFDDDYRWFLLLVAMGVGRSVGAARAREAERERTRAIADFERARTRLFDDVSHELRTPLALDRGLAGAAARRRAGRALRRLARGGPAQRVADAPARQQPARLLADRGRGADRRVPADGPGAAHRARSPPCSAPRPSAGGSS